MRWLLSKKTFQSVFLGKSMINIKQTALQTNKEKSCNQLTDLPDFISMHKVYRFRCSPWIRHLSWLMCVSLSVRLMFHLCNIHTDLFTIVMETEVPDTCISLSVCNCGDDGLNQWSSGLCWFLCSWLTSLYLLCHLQHSISRSSVKHAIQKLTIGG